MGFKPVPGISQLECESADEYLTRLPNAVHHRISAGGWQINAITAGTGPRVLLIHGLGSSWQWWQPTIDRLIETNSVLAIDLPGAGESSHLTHEPTVEHYASLMRDLLHEFGPSWVVGHSLGGFVGVQAALQGVPGIEGLFLYSPAGFGKVENPYFRTLSIPVLGKVLSYTGKPGTRLLLRSLVHNDSLVPQMLCWTDLTREALDQFLYQLRIGVDWLGRTNEQLTVELHQPVTVPLHLVWGKYDSVFSLKSARNAAEVLGLSDFQVAKASGHFIHLDEPDWFVDELRGFMNKEQQSGI